jgi:hypothetical protein
MHSQTSTLQLLKRDAHNDVVDYMPILKISRASVSAMVLEFTMDYTKSFE